jgi:hypothetical protein
VRSYEAPSRIFVVSFRAHGGNAPHGLELTRGSLNLAPDCVLIPVVVLIFNEFLAMRQVQPDVLLEPRHQRSLKRSRVGVPAIHLDALHNSLDLPLRLGVIETVAAGIFRDTGELREPLKIRLGPASFIRDV